jgi:hypothetical protein
MDKEVNKCLRCGDTEDIDLAHYDHCFFCGVDIDAEVAEEEDAERWHENREEEATALGMTVDEMDRLSCIEYEEYEKKQKAAMGLIQLYRKHMDLFVVSS